MQNGVGGQHHSNGGDNAGNRLFAVDARSTDDEIQPAHSHAQQRREAHAAHGRVAAKQPQQEARAQPEANGLREMNQECIAHSHRRQL
ncbi:MAG: hypothetical protein FJ030_00230 [Chloroflexi bacterium]|nr:hypothetical protein [Chloroflexota bacterium]